MGVKWFQFMYFILFNKCVSNYIIMVNIINSKVNQLKV